MERQPFSRSHFSGVRESKADRLSHILKVFFPVRRFSNSSRSVEYVHTDRRVVGLVLRGALFSSHSIESFVMKIITESAFLFFVFLNLPFFVVENKKKKRI